MEAHIRHPFCRCRTDCAVSHTHRDSHSHPRGKQGKSDLQVPACGQQLPDIQLPEVPLHVHQCRQAPEGAECTQPIQDGRRTDGRAARYPLRRPDRHFRRGGYPADFGRFRHLRRRFP